MVLAKGILFNRCLPRYRRDRRCLWERVPCNLKKPPLVALDSTERKRIVWCRLGCTCTADFPPQQIILIVKDDAFGRVISRSCGSAASPEVVVYSLGCTIITIVFIVGRFPAVLLPYKFLQHRLFRFLHRSIRCKVPQY